MLTREQLCPVCGRENQCRVANGNAYDGPCWCEAFTLPAEVQQRLADVCPDRICLCGDCLVRFSDSPAASSLAELSGTQLVQGEDYYLDESGRMVFTAAYLLKRGHCCDIGCRHCPYPKSETDKPSDPP